LRASVRSGESRRSRSAGTAARIAALLCWLALGGPACAPRSTLPIALSDEEFWTLIKDSSEQPGTFTLSDNFVSNEPLFVENLRRLRPGGGVYIGVGPEQNFSYIARLRPEMAFIVDIRRENRSLHLLYKALFELCEDRVDFVSRLFSRPRPAGLHASADVDTLFRAYNSAPPLQEQYSRTAALVREHLVGARGFPLEQSDLDSIDGALKAFYSDGPGIHFWGSREVPALRPPYWQLMSARDVTGQARSFLASDDAFRFVKALHTRNLIVPIVGDFAGSRALRHVGGYVRARRGLVTAFYGSNVGVYLTKDGMRAFCRNLGALPASRNTWFIDSDSVRSLTSKLKTCTLDGT
jgi:hypothetical protein